MSIWEGLDVRRRVIAGLALVAIVVAVLGIGRMATTPSMSLLYAGLDPTAAGEVVAALEAEGIEYEVTDTRIMVEGFRARSHSHDVGGARPSCRRIRRIRDPRRAFWIWHHQPDVRCCLLAGQGGGAGAHHRKLSERSLRARASGESHITAVRAHA